MNTRRLIPPIILLSAMSVIPASAQQKTRLGDNAALRYWSAFAQMQDSAISDQEAKELTGILDGSVPYADSKYKELVEKNKPALETMIRGTAFSTCDWGLEYQLGSKTPIDYVRKALTLGRLNVLYAFHLALTGDKDGAVRVLAAGLLFSRDVANGGTLFATLIAKNLLANHLRVMAFLLHMGQLSDAQRLVLQKAVMRLGPEGLDWQSAVKLELEISHAEDKGLEPQASASLERIRRAYVDAVNNPSSLPTLQQIMAGAPPSVREIIPNPKHMLEEKQDLSDKLQQIRSLLQ